MTRNNSFSPAVPGRHLVLFSTLALVLLMGPGLAYLEAQAPKPVQLLISATPQTYTAAKQVLIVRADKASSILWLRPNSETQVYFFVRNPSEDDRQVVVRLVDHAGQVVAASAEQLVAGGATQGVNLVLPPAKPPVPPQPAPKEAPSTWLNGQGLPPQFQVVLAEVSKKAGKVESIDVERFLVGIMVPSWYVDATGTYTGTEQRLVATVREKRDSEGALFLRGPDCPVQMAVLSRETATGRLTPAAPLGNAILKRILTPGQGSVNLSVQDKRLAALPDARGQVELAVDGYQRAFTFVTDFRAVGGDTPLKRTADPDVLGQPPKRPSLHFETAPYWPAGVTYPIRLGLDDILTTLPLTPLDFEVRLRVELGRRTTAGAFDPFFTERLDGHRFQRICVNPQGPSAGALVLKTEVRDWALDVPTQGLFGGCSLRVAAVRLEQGQEKLIPLRESTSPEDLWVYFPLMLDGTPPEITELGPVSKRLVAGQKLKVMARGTDPETEIASAVFFVGKPVPDPKVPGTFLMPEEAVKVKGEPQDKKGETWVAQLPVALEKPAAVDVSVLFVNKAGLKEFGTVRLELELAQPEKPKEKPTTGRIIGVVREGNRPQANLTVLLFDAAGAAKGSATTNDKGEFVFKDIQPGAYRVTATKNASATRGTATAEVLAGEGKPKPVTVNLTR